MPDRPDVPVPRDWNEAFAALPLESPGNDEWQRLTRALDGAAARPTSLADARPMRRRTRWPLWLATAAAVSAVALVPLLRQNETSVQPDATRVADVATHAPTGVPATATSDASLAISAPQSTIAPAAVASAQPGERTAARRKPVGTPTRKPAPVATPQPMRRDNGTRVADVDAAPADTAPAATKTAVDPSTTGIADSAVAIQSLQAQSAQLEALVALARDERVSSASGAALGVELDGRIGRIDASLSQPGLSDAERAGLWQQRVQAMRELAGIETTQRLLVTQGERYDGALVSVD
ncbi:MAG TPA: hypothetical protein VIT90_06200 [Lysobacter sp.]